MTKENLLKYLRDPNYLNQVSYQELKTLVAEYPSSLSLRYLLALKSKQEGNEDHQRQLEFLATYGIDRVHLFNVFNRSELEEVLPEGVVLQEDYLELKELSALEREISTITSLGAGALAANAATARSEVPRAAEAIAPISTQDEYYTFDFNEEIKLGEKEAIPQKSKEEIQENLSEIESLFKDIDEPETSLAVVEMPLTDAVDLELQETLKGGEFPRIPLEVMDTDIEVIGDTPPPIKGVANNSIVPLIEEDGLEVNPVPKTSFATWFKGNKSNSQFNGFDLVGYNSKGLIEELIQDKKVPTNGDAPENGLEENLNMEQDIASETLAQLLVLQGHYSKASMMYEQLKLIYPEKNSFFAAEIERVKNLEANNAFNG